MCYYAISTVNIGGDVDIGDLVFYRGDHISDGDSDGLEQSSFRYITHVGVVYNVNGKTFDDKKQYQNDKDTKFCRWIHFKKDQKRFSIYMDRLISFKESKSKHAGEICWKLRQYKN